MGAGPDLIWSWSAAGLVRCRELRKEHSLSSARHRLFISAKKDAWINTEKVGHLTSMAADHGLPVESVAYDADHAFFNNTRPEVFDGEASADAWSKALAFFRQHLS